MLMQLHEALSRVGVFGWPSIIPEPQAPIRHECEVVSMYIT
jgi:hypothetical protein